MKVAAPLATAALTALLEFASGSGGSSGGNAAFVALTHRRPPSPSSSSSSSWKRKTAAVVAVRSRPDSADAVAEAERIAQEFGADSKEARLAWETVEEIDASDTSPAISRPTPTISPSESRKIDYLVEINSLAFLLDETLEKMTQMKSLAVQIRKLELSDPSLSKLGPGSEDMKRALQEAKAAIEVHGPGSDEAEKAWRALETCTEEEEECSIDNIGAKNLKNRYNAAALKAHHYYDAVVDPELLSEAIDAFDSIEALNHFVQVEKNRLAKNK